MNAHASGRGVEPRRLLAVCVICRILMTVENLGAVCPECKAAMRVMCSCGMISHLSDPRYCTHCGLAIADLLRWQTAAIDEGRQHPKTNLG
jgi:hypothetical protein